MPYFALFVTFINFKLDHVHAEDGQEDAEGTGEEH